MKPLGHAVSPFHLDAATTAFLKAEVQRRRQALAEKRANRGVAIDGEPLNRRQGERRVGPFDRREHESYDRRADERRQFATMEDKLAAEAKRHEAPDSVRFTGSPSGFMDSLK